MKTYDDIEKVILDPLQNGVMVIWIAIATLLSSMALMWTMDLSHWPIFTVINVFLTIVGTLVILMVTFRASSLIGFGLLGALINLLEDKDKSQGAAVGLRTLINIALAISHAWIVGAFIILTTDSANSPMAFWILFIGSALLLSMQRIDTSKTYWAPKIVGTYAVVMMILYAWSLTGGAYNGRAFDPNTSNALYMVDPVTKTIDTEGRTEEECLETPCYSSLTGNMLVPISAEDAINLTPTGFLKKFVRSTSDNINQKRKPVVTSKNKAKPVVKQPVSQEAERKDCSSSSYYSHTRECEMVTFSTGQYFDRAINSEICIVRSKNKSIQYENLGNGFRRYWSTAKWPVTVYFHQIVKGEKYGSKGGKC